MAEPTFTFFDYTLFVIFPIALFSFSVFRYLKERKKWR